MLRTNSFFLIILSWSYYLFSHLCFFLVYCLIGSLLTWKRQPVPECLLYIDIFFLGFSERLSSAFILGLGCDHFLPLITRCWNLNRVSFYANRTESSAQLLQPPELISTSIEAGIEEVSSSAKPLIQQLRKLPKRIKKLIAVFPPEEACHHIFLHCFCLLLKSNIPRIYLSDHFHNYFLGEWGGSFPVRHVVVIAC